MWDLGPNIINVWSGQSGLTCLERVINSLVLEAVLLACNPKISWGGVGRGNRMCCILLNSNRAYLQSAKSPKKVFLENLINLPSLSLASN